MPTRKGRRRFWWVNRTTGRSDGGQSGLEYLGLVLVVVAIVGGLLATGIGSELTQKISAQVCAIGGGGDCGSGSGSGDSRGDGTGDDANASGTTGGGTQGGTTGGTADPVELAADAPKTQAELDYEAAQRELDDANEEYAQAKKVLLDAADALGQIAADELGITDALKCFQEGDLAACGETALNVAMQFIGGIPAKIVKKYGLSPSKWKKAAKLGKDIVKHGKDLYSGTKGMWKAKKKADRLKGKLADLKSRLPKRKKKPVTCAVSHSFLPGTPVLLANGTRLPIETIRVGDTVVATDPETGLTAARPVQRTITTYDDKHFTRLTVATASGPAVITATDTHPFWSADRGDWLDAGDIGRGTRLRTPDGTTAEVTVVTRYTHRRTTHDLTVAGIHTYYVGVGGGSALVHNKDCTIGSVPGPNGETFPLPKGAKGTPVTSGKGMAYDIPAGTKGLDPRVTQVRVMDPVTTGKYQYPKGYVVYMNKAGQSVNPATGQTLSKADPYNHLSIP
ncbi:polymorphic toxin-type HINT domain-containing protein [Streptomyces sp. NPDC101062]|uniref:polymorphic toxin-type HINT domain-containing protein n=1 Tax=unclassified Streptomyces TaxID=2593676 RepID=UPI0037FDFD34